MNNPYRNDLSKREIKKIDAVKKQYKVRNMGLIKKTIKVGALGVLMLSSYRCGQANAQEIVRKSFSDLENVVAKYETTDEVRDLYKESIYGFRLSECETQCYLH